jgi:glyoxylase-like metal-dependent hydrolase (beta-lactamase superfamily II)
VGRTDLWGGSFDALSESIRTRLFTLPGDSRVVAGHGEDTTIAEEARLNPFVGSRATPLV